jgi:TPR repeat protein
MYEGGLSIQPDKERARQLYGFGASRGEFDGCISLARLLASGKMGAPDHQGALHWYRVVVEMKLGEEGEEGENEDLEEARAFVSRYSGPAA